MDHKITLGLYSNNDIFLNGISSLLNDMEKYQILVKCVGKGVDDCMPEDLEQIPELFLLHIDMTENKWREVLSALKQKSSNTKMLIMSKYHNKYNVVKAFSFGANGYIDCNCSIEKLHKALLSIYYTNVFCEDIDCIDRLQSIDKELLESVTQLTNMERKALSLFASDLSYKEIAESLNVNLQFVEAYKQILFEKFNVKSRVGLLIWAHAIGELNLNNASYTTD